MNFDINNIYSIEELPQDQIKPVCTGNSSGFSNEKIKVEISPNQPIIQRMTNKEEYYDKNGEKIGSINDIVRSTDKKKTGVIGQVTNRDTNLVNNNKRIPKFLVDKDEDIREERVIKNLADKRKELLELDRKNPGSTDYRKQDVGTVYFYHRIFEREENARIAGEKYGRDIREILCRAIEPDSDHSKKLAELRKESIKIKPGEDEVPGFEEVKEQVRELNKSSEKKYTYEDIMREYYRKMGYEFLKNSRTGEIIIRIMEDVNKVSWEEIKKNRTETVKYKKLMDKIIREISSNGKRLVMYKNDSLKVAQIESVREVTDKMVRKLIMTEIQEIPAIPANPEIQEIPANPEIQEIPANPGITENQENPGITENQENPGITENQENPGITENQENPGITENQENPGITENQENPGITENQENPGITENQENPGITENQENPGITEKIKSWDSKNSWDSWDKIKKYEKDFETEVLPNSKSKEECLLEYTEKIKDLRSEIPDNSNTILEERNKINIISIIEKILLGSNIFIGTSIIVSGGIVLVGIGISSIFWIIIIISAMKEIFNSIKNTVTRVKEGSKENEYLKAEEEKEKIEETINYINEIRKEKEKN